MTISPNHSIGGDKVDGDKVGGDKIGRDKLTIGNITINNQTFSNEQLSQLIAQLQQTRPAASATTAAKQLHSHHKAIMQQLSAPRYRLDSRFVQMTLLVDQGAEAQDIRFTPDKQRQKYHSLSTLIDDIDENATVILGKPGSGKTTLLRHRQFEHAISQLEQPTDQVAFFAPLNAYRQPDPHTPLPDPYQWLAGEWRIRHPALPDFRTFYETGNLLLLLDGINEIPHTDKADYRQRIAQWQQFWQRTAHYGNQVIFSCRTLDYSAPLSHPSAPVRQTRLEPLTSGQIEQFLRLHLAEDAAKNAWQTLRRDGQQLTLFDTPFFLRLLTDQINATGEMPTGQAALLTGFVRRALHREMDIHQHPLFAPGALLSEEDCQQIRFHEWESPYDLPPDGVLIPALTRLAYQMQTGRESEERSLVRLNIRTARTWLKEWVDEGVVDAAISAGCQLNVLDKDKRELTYFHQLIQEYFAARVLTQAPDPQLVAVAWHADEIRPSLAETVAALETSDPLPPLATTGWEETMLLAAAMSADQAQFVQALLAVNLPLAARCAALPAVTVPAALRAQIQTSLMARMQNENADLRARIACALAAAELGDPRFTRHTGAHGDYLLPPTVLILGGEYPIGDDASGYSQEKPAHTVPIAPFEMAVFAVTNAEYRLFMQAGGYADEQWWQTEAARAWLRGEGSNEGRKQAVRDEHQLLQSWSEEQLREVQATPEQIDYWLWLKGLTLTELESKLEEKFSSEKVFRQPEYWNDSRFNHPAQPVVGITWFEARAYCAWLSAQTGDLVRLPTEVEWEAAAGGLAKRPYAWGNTFDTANGNTFETHIRATTPVGVFPAGNTPEGIADLSGNVWEWTSTIWGENLQTPDFPYPYRADDGREDEQKGDVRRVVRGGSWNYTHQSARASYRYNNHPFYRDYNLGLRWVVGRRSPSQ